MFVFFFFCFTKHARFFNRHGQELQEVRSSDDEMPPTISIKDTKHDVPVKGTACLIIDDSREVMIFCIVEPKETAPTVVSRPRVSLLSSYRQSWKARNHHFVRYTDVKLKDERRPTVTDLANQKHILQKVHGWKVYHLTAQIEEMVLFSFASHFQFMPTFVVDYRHNRSNKSTSV